MGETLGEDSTGSGWILRGGREIQLTTLGRQSLGPGKVPMLPRFPGIWAEATRVSIEIQRGICSPHSQGQIQHSSTLLLSLLTTALARDF